MQQVLFSLLFWNGQNVKNTDKNLREVATPSVFEGGRDILYL